jgi:hypothetical protein
MKSSGWAVMLSLLCVAPISCTRTVQLTEQMTWECAPGEYNPGYYAKPDEYVRFRFVENPHCFELESSKNFCAEMKKAGHSVVNAEYKVWGYGGEVHGFTMLAVDGRPLENVGGWGSIGSENYAGRCPIDYAFEGNK